jgi:hypothetical protein
MIQKSKFPLILTSVFSITLASCISFQSYHHDYLVEILSDFVYEEVTDPESLKIDSIDYVKSPIVKDVDRTVVINRVEYLIRFDYKNSFGGYDGYEWLLATYDIVAEDYFWRIYEQFEDADKWVELGIETWELFDLDYSKGSLSENEINR